MQSNPAAQIVLPTGRTPEPVYRSFADRGGSLADATIMLLDEFGLPPRSHARCDNMLQRDLLDRLEEPPARLLTWNTAAEDLDAMCADMDVEAQRGIDLVILGIGGNGHLGINEPGTPSDAPSRVVELHAETAAATSRYGAETAPTWGVTLGLGPILRASAVWLLATGAHKAAIVRAALEGPIGSEVPASYVRRHENAIVFLDEAAASDL